MVLRLFSLFFIFVHVARSMSITRPASINANNTLQVIHPDQGFPPVLVLPSKNLTTNDPVFPPGVDPTKPYSKYERELPYCSLELSCYFFKPASHNTINQFETLLQEIIREFIDPKEQNNSVGYYHRCTQHCHANSTPNYKEWGIGDLVQGLTRLTLQGVAENLDDTEWLTYGQLTNALLGFHSIWRDYPGLDFVCDIKDLAEGKKIFAGEIKLDTFAPV